MHFLTGETPDTFAWMIPMFFLLFTLLLDTGFLSDVDSMGEPNGKVHRNRNTDGFLGFEIEIRQKGQ